jgi:hypothetical protein
MFSRCEAHAANGDDRTLMEYKGETVNDVNLEIGITA